MLAVKSVDEPALTDFIQHFTMPVGAGSPIALKRVNRPNKPAPPKNTYFAYLFAKLEIALCQ